MCELGTRQSWFTLALGRSRHTAQEQQALDDGGEGWSQLLYKHYFIV
jgi:hypothetical protein